MDSIAPSMQFLERMKQGEVSLGTCISFSDPTVTEALCNLMDFLWIDMEHNPLSLEVIQAHIMATKGSRTTPIVRVPWNDPVLIKPVLDIGAAGVIVPFVRTVEDAKRAVAACRYPPDGIRGYGPRRPSNYGRLGGPEFCRAQNETVLTILQIEHIDAVNDIDNILAVPGVDVIVIGSNDLSGSMGRMGEPRHPEVLEKVEHVIARAHAANVFVGIAIGDDVTLLNEWIDKGANWLAMGGDFSLLLRGAMQVTSQVRAHADARARG
jgi:2-dehydro-3-deoxyglucarate aldolase/4-hydroxy-2-oxoheptanedioate aldolase